MTTRRVLTSIAVATATGLLFLANAAPANAALGVTDNGNGTITVDGVGATNGYVEFCDASVTVLNCNGLAGQLNVLYYVSGISTVVTIAGGRAVTPFTGTAHTLPAGNYTVNFEEFGGLTRYGGIQGVTIGDPTSSGIPDWVQAYGRFGKDAACRDGWNPSWQPWAELITGGWVCTRSLPSLG